MPTKPKIKVLHVIKTLGLGGAETNLLNLIREFNPERIECHVGYSVGGEHEPQFLKAGARLFRYAARDHRVKSLASLGIVGRIARYIASQRIDVTHTHNFSGHIWGALASKLSGARIVEHVHDFRYLDPDDYERRRGLNQQYKFVRYMKGWSDKVIVLTRQNAEFLVEGGYYPPASVVEMQNGIPFSDATDLQEKRASIRRKFGVGEDRLIILTAVRMAEEKNVDLILRIAPKVIGMVPNAVFIIAGSGHLLEGFRQQVSREGLDDNIRLPGFHPDVYGLLAASDIMLLPSFLELHSIAILEAMSMRVPVVVSRDVGCNSEFIEHRRNGYLRDPFSDDGWADDLVELLSDPARRLQVGEEGYRTCRQLFDIRQTAERLVNVYESLLNADE